MAQDGVTAGTNPIFPHLEARSPTSQESGADGGSVLPFDTPRMTRSGYVAKRAADLIGATLLAIVTLPVWVAIAVAIRLDTPGPVLFRQERVGARPERRSRQLRWALAVFTIFKFRTMVSDADPEVHKTAVRQYATGGAGAGPDPTAPYKLTHDPRITRVGRFLRRTSLDELPQLLNVLRGQMSLVGPRPLPPYEVAEYQPWHYERLCALPGITGKWQIEGRGRTSFDEGTRMDIDYVRNWSIKVDLALLIRTLPAVLSRRGAG